MDFWFLLVFTLAVPLAPTRTGAATTSEPEITDRITDNTVFPTPATTTPVPTMTVHLTDSTDTTTPLTTTGSTTTNTMTTTTPPFSTTTTNTMTTTTPPPSTTTNTMTTTTLPLSTTTNTMTTTTPPLSTATYKTTTTPPLSTTATNTMTTTTPPLSTTTTNTMTTTTPSLSTTTTNTMTTTTPPPSTTTTTTMATTTPPHSTTTNTMTTTTPSLSTTTTNTMTTTTPPPSTTTTTTMATTTPPHSTTTNTMTTTTPSLSTTTTTTNMTTTTPPLSTSSTTTTNTTMTTPPLSTMTNTTTTTLPLSTTTTTTTMTTTTPPLSTTTTANTTTIPPPLSTTTTANTTTTTPPLSTTTMTTTKPPLSTTTSTTTTPTTTNTTTTTTPLSTTLNTTTTTPPLSTTTTANTTTTTPPLSTTTTTTTNTTTTTPPLSTTNMNTTTPPLPTTINTTNMTTTTPPLSTTTTTTTNMNTNTPPLSTTTTTTNTTTTTPPLSTTTTDTTTTTPPLLTTTTNATTTSPPLSTTTTNMNTTTPPLSSTINTTNMTTTTPPLLTTTTNATTTSPPLSTTTTNMNTTTPPLSSTINTTNMTTTTPPLSTTTNMTTTKPPLSTTTTNMTTTTPPLSTTTTNTTTTSPSLSSTIYTTNMTTTTPPLSTTTTTNMTTTTSPLSTTKTTNTTTTTPPLSTTTTTTNTTTTTPPLSSTINPANMTTTKPPLTTVTTTAMTTSPPTTTPLVCDNGGISLNGVCVCPDEWVGVTCSQRNFCQEQKWDRFTFPSTPIGRFAYSEETCPQGTSGAGKPETSTKCSTKNGSPSFEFPPHVLKCEQTLIDIQQNLTNSGDLESLASSTQILTSKPEELTAEDVTAAAQIANTLLLSPNATESVREAAVATVSQLLNTRTSDDSKENNATLGLTLTLDQLSVTLSLSLNSAQSQVVQPNLVVQSAQVPAADTQGVQFTSLSGTSGSFIADRIQLNTNTSTIMVENGFIADALIYVRFPPGEAVSGRQKPSNVSLGFVLYQNDRFFRSRRYKHQRATIRVLSASVKGQERNVVPQHVEMLFRPSMVNGTSLYDFACVFWNYSIEDWSTDGCSKGNASGGLLRCLCNHTTNFAALWSFRENYEYAEALDWISIIGLSFSILGLAVTIIHHIRENFHRNSGEQQNNKNLEIALLCICISLLAFIITFLSGVGNSGSQNIAQVEVDTQTNTILDSEEHVEPDSGSCSAVAALLHFFLLATFMWNSMYGTQLVLLDRTAHSSLPPYWTKLSHAVGWGVPAVVMAITLGVTYRVDNPLGYRQEEFCWLAALDKAKHFDFGKPMFWGFLVPLGLILIYNIVLLVLTFLTTRKTDPHKKRRKFLASFFLAGVLCLSWTLGYLLLVTKGHAHLVFSIVFCLCTITQGLLIFILFTARTRTFKETMSRGILALKDKNYSPSQIFGRRRDTTD